MKKIFVKIIIIFVLIICLLFLIINKSRITGLVGTKSNIESNVDFDYSLTKAVCYGNKCQDFEVKCLNEKVISMAPISGFITFGGDWKDLREDKGLC